MSTTIRIGMAEVEKLAGDLKNAFEVIGVSASGAVNRVAESVRKESVRGIISQVNLTEAYVDGKFAIEREATPDKPQAVISVSDEAIFLTRFNARQDSIANVWTPAKYAATFGSLAAPAWLPPGKSGKRKSAQWIPRRGDPNRGIAQGHKDYGMTVNIHPTHGAIKLRHAYLGGARDGKEFKGRFETFSHVSKGSQLVKPLYGPSAYQVVKGVWRDEEGNIFDMLSAEVGNDVMAGITKALTKT